MGDNSTKHSQRATAGVSKATRQDYMPPETRVFGPDGRIHILGRKSESMDPLIAYRKFNPSRRHAGNSRRSRRIAGAPAGRRNRGGAAAALSGFGRSSCNGIMGNLMKGPMGILGRIPLMNLLVTAALTHRIWCFVTRRFFSGGGLAACSDDRRLAMQATAGGAYDGEYDEFDELDDLDEHEEHLLEQMQHKSILPTMLRASLPRPHRNSLVKRAAQKYHSRPRDYRTAHQMMHGGPRPATALSRPSGGKSQDAARAGNQRQAQRRPLGKLEKMDLIVRQQVRAAMLAQQRQQEQVRLQQHEPRQLEAGPSGAVVQFPGQQQPQEYAQPRVPISSALVQAAAPGVAGAYVTPHRLQPGPPPPPTFRPLPPELLARLQGKRYPNAAAVAPAAKAASAGPPPLDLEYSSCPDGSLAAAGVCDSESGRAGQRRGEGLVSDAGGSATRVNVKVEGDGLPEDAEEKIVVPRVARGARNMIDKRVQEP